jgi:hypothetical protein
LAHKAANIQGIAARTHKIGLAKRQCSFLNQLLIKVDANNSLGSVRPFVFISQFLCKTDAKSENEDIMCTTFIPSPNTSRIETLFEPTSLLTSCHLKAPDLSNSFERAL